MMAIRVLVVDDSSFFRKRIAEALLEDNGIEVADFACNGKEALEKLSSRVNVITLDINMPGMGGIEFLRELRGRGLRSRVIVVSSLTASGAEASLAVLREGADEIIVKPREGTPEAIAAFRRELRAKVKALAGAGIQKPGATAIRAAKPPERRKLPVKLSENCVELVAIGASTGGPSALRRVLADLPRGFPAPVVIAQHMPPLFTAQLALDLSASSGMRGVEAVDGMKLEPGIVAVAPGGKNLALRRRAGAFYCGLDNISPDPALPSPSVGHLFGSLRVSASSVLAVMLTGIGSDGAEAMADLRVEGAITLAQDELSSVVYGMPRAALEMGGADEVVGLADMGARIGSYVAATRQERAGGKKR